MASEKNKWDSSPKKALDSYPAEKGFPVDAGGIGLPRGFLKRAHARKARRWRRSDTVERCRNEIGEAT